MFNFRLVKKSTLDELETRASQAVENARLLTERLDIRRIHYDDVEYLKEQIKNCNKDYQPWYKKIFSHEWK